MNDTPARIRATYARQALEWDDHDVAVRRTSRIHGITRAQVTEALIPLCEECGGVLRHTADCPQE